MKAIKCELCGSGDLIKENGVFVCQHCGTKYSLEEAKKLMVEISGSVDVQGTVKIDKDTKRELIVESQVSFYEIFVDGQKLGSFTKTAKVFIDNGPHNVYCAAPGLQSISITIESGSNNVVLNLVKKSGFLIKLILTRIS